MEARAEETRTIPIVFVNLVVPIGPGFVASLARPGGNLAGLVNNEPTMVGKWLEMLKEMAPATEGAALLFSPVTAPWAQDFLKPLNAVAERIGVVPIRTPVNDDIELISAVAERGRATHSSIAVMPDSFMVARTDHVNSLAMQYCLPLISPYRSYTERGGLLSCGPDIADNYRRAANYVDRILKSDMPGELPVQARVNFQLVINSKTAKTLGLDVPPEPTHHRRRPD
jgi:putative ABC transport system substrate-binding protein